MQGIMLCPSFLNVVANEHNKESSKYKKSVIFRTLRNADHMGSTWKKAELVICVFKQSNSKNVNWNLMC